MVIDAETLELATFAGYRQKDKYKLFIIEFDGKEYQIVSYHNGVYKCREVA